MVNAYYIPVGIRNLTPLFAMIDLVNLSEYYLELIDADDNVVATTPIAKVTGCEDDEDMVRIFFLNNLGTIDGVNFKKQKVEHEAKSNSYEKQATYPLDRGEHGVNRFNVKSNDTYRLITTEYGEDEKNWLDELFDSPMAWIAWEGGQGIPAGYLPIVIQDQKTEKFKTEDRYSYETEIEFKFSHDKFNIRN